MINASRKMLFLSLCSNHLSLFKQWDLPQILCGQKCQKAAILVWGNLYMRIEWHNKNTLLRWQKGQAMQGPVSQKYNSKMKVTLCCTMVSLSKNRSGNIIIFSNYEFYTLPINFCFLLFLLNCDCKHFAKIGYVTQGPLHRTVCLEQK